MRCPYCGNGIAKKLEHADLSFKRRAILTFVMHGGPAGVPEKNVKERFFENCSDVTLRTTIHGINTKIIPNQMIQKGGFVKVIRKD